MLDAAEERPVDLLGTLEEHRPGTAGPLGHLNEADRVRAVRRAHHDHALAARRDLLNCVLASGRGIADIVLARETLPQHVYYLRRVDHRERSLGDHRELCGILGGEGKRVVNCLDEMHRTFRQLAHGADHLRVAGVPDQEDLSLILEMTPSLDMDLRHQWTGSV